jgi:hypothetical protein
VVEDALVGDVNITVLEEVLLQAFEFDDFLERVEGDVHAAEIRLLVGAWKCKLRRKDLYQRGV